MAIRCLLITVGIGIAGIAYFYSKSSISLSENKISWNQDMAKISFLCMQLASISGNKSEFNRLLEAGILHSNPSSREFVRLYEASDPRIPEDIKNIFDVLKSHKYDLTTFMFASYIKDSIIETQKFVTNDDSDEKKHQAESTFIRLSCSSIN